MYFGPRVVGEDKYQEEKAAAESPAARFGPRVVGDQSEPDTATAIAEPPTDSGDDWPQGFTYERHGAYYAVVDPNGDPVESDKPSGKWQGEENARQAAWKRAAELEAGDDTEPEDERDEFNASTDEVLEALAENPALVDQFMRAELQRPDGVRPVVLDALEEAEQNRDADPRAEVLETINSLRGAQ